MVPLHHVRNEMVLISSRDAGAGEVEGVRVSRLSGGAPGQSATSGAFHRGFPSQ